MKGAIISTGAKRSGETPAFLLLAMVSTAFLIRMVVVSLVVRNLPDPTRDFEQFGWEMGWVARSIASGHGFASPFFPFTGPTALVPPAYPYLLAAIFRVFGVYSLHSGLAILTFNSLASASTCFPIYLLARDIADRRIAKWAAWAWVVYPFSIYYATIVWEWALTALLFTTCIWLLTRLHTRARLYSWLGFGVLYGVTALVNPAVLSVLPFLFLIPLWRLHRARHPWVLKAVFTTVTVVAVLTPWTIRTYRIMHVLVPIRDNYWLEFYAGNTADSFKSNVAWAHPASNPAEMQAFIAQGETPYLAARHRLAVASVTAHPVRFAIATVRRIVRYWTGFWSFSARYLHKEPLDVPNVFFCTAITAFMLRGIRRLWHSDRAAALPFVVLLSVFPITYYLSHASMDYRQPIEPAILILAIYGLLKRTPPPTSIKKRHLDRSSA